jgi:predicted MFS family arabinose efflux permease
MPHIVEKFHVDATLLGQFSGVYYIGYAVVHLPLGILLDRVGPKIVMPISILLAITGMLPLIYADNWLFPVLGRALVGIGSSAAILGVFSMTRLCFEEKMFSRMLGFAVTIGLLGAIYGGQPVHYLLTQWGWETVFKMICGVGLGLAILTFFMTPSLPPKKGAEKKSMFQDLKTVFKNPLLLGTCILGGLMVGPLEGFADVWASQFLRVVYGYDASTAASLPSLIFLGMCIGSPLLSYVGETRNQYDEIIILSGFLMGASFLAILFLPLTTFIISFLFVLIGILCAYQILVIYKASTYGPPRLTSLATAVANMIIMLFGYVFHTTIGRSMDFFWDGHTGAGAPLYSPQTFKWGLCVIPLGLFIAAIGFFMIKIKKISMGRGKA